jgi:hypothetical protein
MKISTATLLILLSACSAQSSQDEPLHSKVRETAPQQEDNLATTNDESNDQPLGHYGVLTLCVTNNGSGNSYPLDADMDGFDVTTIYFPKGGNVDFTDCTLDEDMTGECDDDAGKGWVFDGEC